MLAVAILALAACNTRVSTTGGTPVAGPPAPKPTLVVVDDFVVDARAVKVDSGIGGTVRRSASGESTADAATAAANKVSDIVETTLVNAINGMTLPAQPAGAVVPAPPFVEIRGVVLSINEGNQTRRNLIGFGAGRSGVEATVQVFYVDGNGPPRLLQSYDATGESKRTPGLGFGAVSAASGQVGLAAANAGMHVAGGSDVESDAKRLAEKLSRSIGQLFVQEGWIPASAVPAGFP